MPRSGTRRRASSPRTPRASLTLVASLLLAGCGDGGGAQRFYTIGTGGTGGLYYPLGGALAARLSSLDTLRTFTAEVTGASIENINRVMRGEMDLGLAIGTTVWEAYHGGEDFDSPQDRLRIVAPLYPNLTHVLVAAGSPIRSIEELRGRRVSVGVGGSGTEQVSRHVLEVHGLDYTSVQPRYLSFTESTSALADGAIDAAILSVGYPAAAVLESLATGRGRLLPLSAARIAELAEQYPYYAPATIPAGTYANQRDAIETMATLNWIVARDDLDPDVARRVVELLAEERASLAQIVSIVAQVDMQNLRDPPIPLHAAAQEWLDSRRDR